MKEPSVSKRCSLECDTVHEFPHPFQKKKKEYFIFDQIKSAQLVYV